MADFTFLHPSWLLALIPLAVLLPWLAQRRAQSGLIAAHLQPDNKPSSQRVRVLSLLLLSIGWILAVIAMAGPSWQKQMLPASNLSGARVIIMDMSNSMYATDLPPNRLTQARYKAMDLLPYWQEGTTGLIAYAGDGYIISPLTADSTTLTHLIPGLSPAILPIQGSNAAAGVKAAIDLLRQAGHPLGDLILITDGLSEKEAMQTDQLLQDNQYRLSILAVATPQGAPVTMPDGRLLQDNQGNTVLSKMHPRRLETLAASHGGIMVRWRGNDQDILALIEATTHLTAQSEQAQDKTIEEKLNGGFWLLIPLILLFLPACRKGIAFSCLLIVFLPVEKSVASPWLNQDQDAYQHYQQQEYQAAADLFQSPAWQGAAKYQAGDYEGAIESLSGLTDPASRYNLANAYAQAGQLDKARDIYQDLLNADPDNTDAKTNLDIVEQQLSQQQANQQSQQGQQGQQGQGSPSGQQAGNSSRDSNVQSASGQQPSSQQNSQTGQSGNASQSDQTASASAGDAQQERQSRQDEQSQQASGHNDDSAGEVSPPSADSQQPSQAGHPVQAGSDPNPANSAGNAAQSRIEPAGEQANANAEKSEQPIAGNNEDVSDEDSGDETSGLSASHPTLKKLEQIPDSTRELLRAQIILQAREKPAPDAPENRW
ncbi:VWA domain-containing protein [Photobacterium sp. 2_MG-2023]|uniref:vWA domain-containing protein n=1 Tax=Photobacterium sp. 2_MG-2023 TaxID=3062663 RepID=UPI0026E26BC4|nr:VWA domain-containing protein [Photobacterium sp. 2_MG-2023]MDO6581366.1 VWA domain-containing protein [Photobacterium sp. 2_MG-2023]